MARRSMLAVRLVVQPRRWRQCFLQWLAVIRKIQAAGKGVVVDLSLAELEPFMAVMKPQGLYLCLEAAESEQLRFSNDWRSGKYE